MHNQASSGPNPELEVLLTSGRESDKGGLRNGMCFVMDVVGIGRIESRGAAAELQYPRATVPARVL
jgi:hypothetical protein